VRATLRNRARYEVASNSYAKGIVLTLANDAVGTGLRLRQTDVRGRAEGTDGDAWQHRLTLPRAEMEGRKPLHLEGMSKACQSVTGPVSERGRRDSNPQPPDRQSGTLAN
jgi:hypothetical protein